MSIKIGDTTMFKIAPLTNMFILSVTYYECITNTQLQWRLLGSFYSYNLLPLSSILRPDYRFCHLYFPIAVCLWVRWFIAGSNGKWIPCPFESAPLKETHASIDQAARFPFVKKFQAIITYITTSHRISPLHWGLHSPCAWHGWLPPIVLEYSLWYSCIE